MKRLLLVVLGFSVLFACQQLKEAGTPTQPVHTSSYLLQLNAIIELAEPAHLDLPAHVIHESVREPLTNVYAPASLYDFYHECELARENAQTPTAFDVYATAQEALLFRLAELPDEASAKYLVDLYADPQLHFDAARQLSLGEAMVHCGDRIVPHLTKVKDLRPTISTRVLECIRTGRSYL